MSDRSPTTLLATYALQTRDAPLAPDVREKAVLCLLDALGLGMSARDHETFVAVNSVLTELPDGHRGAVVWPTGRRVPPGDAALANGIAAHAHFQDDTDMDAWAHPGSLIVPVATALAEQRSQSLDVLVRGIVAGYAALNWLGAGGTVGHTLVERGFRASPTLGSIAAAVTATTVLGLGEEPALSAIGLATDVTGGLLEPVRSGAQDWRWQNGTAAWRGTMAGLLAEAGVRGPAEPLAGPQGFLRAFCGIDLPSGWTVAPRSEAILDVWFKRYPILGDNMAPAVAAADLHEDIGDPQAITRIDVHINAHFAAYPGTSYRGPFDTVEQAMASTAFAVAVLLADGDLQHADYPAKLADPLIARLVDAIRVVPEADFGYLDSTVVVRTADQVWSRRTADCRQEEFFRDRAGARQAFQRTTSGIANTRVRGLPDALFGWLDGGPEPSLPNLMADRPEEG